MKVEVEVEVGGGAAAAAARGGGDSGMWGPDSSSCGRVVGRVARERERERLGDLRRESRERGGGRRACGGGGG